MENNGKKVYTLLVEYNSRTGLPTGRVKPNVPEDPNYIAPVDDLDMCPLPGGGGPAMRNVEVFIDAGFTAEIKLQYDTKHITRTTGGTWSIVDRLYNGLLFDITVAGATSYELKIEYGSSNYRAVVTTGVGKYFIPGPFTAITAISITSLDGDYNGDYGGDYF